MSMYAISENTLTVLGNAVRGKVIGVEETPEETIKCFFQFGGGSSTQRITASFKAPKYKIICDNFIINGSGNFVWAVYDGDQTQLYSQMFSVDNPLPLPLEININYQTFDITGYVASPGETLTATITIIPLDENGNEYKYTPLEMADKINTLNIMPPQAFNISGNCQYKFSFNGWDWLINGYKDKIKCENITDASNMFNGSSNFTFIPTINITDPKLEYTFQNCSKIREITVNWTNPSTSTTNAVNSTFSACYSLRTISGLDGWPAICEGHSIYGLYNTFYNCWCLDELVDIPFVYSTYSGTYQFGSVFQNCYRLKRLVFKLPGAGESNTVPLKDATLDLTTIGFGGSKNNLTTSYNSGITADKEVKDNATYQELKDDPDWFSLDVNYSRYNRNSAIETINSLPDCSATGTNNIKFKGQAGALTDGGAINTLTEEEIAVASAKGWTVSFT